MQSAMGQGQSEDSPPRSSLARVLVGYLIAHGAFEVTPQLASSVDLAWKQIAISVANVVATLDNFLAQGVPTTVIIG
jgi:hypothetical protein